MGDTGWVSSAYRYLIKAENFRKEGRKQRKRRVKDQDWLQDNIQERVEEKKLINKTEEKSSVK